MGRDQALSRIDDYFNNGDFEAELARRIAFKTESNLAGCEAALQAYLDDELVPCLADLGFERMDQVKFLEISRSESLGTDWLIQGRLLD